MAWRKSSFSFSNGNCVEVDDDYGWRKTSYSNGHSECVEVATLPAVLVRDTKDNGTGPVLTYTQEEWRAFVNRLSGN